MTLSKELADQCSFVDELIGDQASELGRAGKIPNDILRRLGTDGLLCPQVPASVGGPGFNSLDAANRPHIWAVAAAPFVA